MADNKPAGWGRAFYRKPTELSVFQVRITDGPTFNISLLSVRDRVSKSGKAYLYRITDRDLGGDVLLCIPVSSFNRHVVGEIRAVPIFIISLTPRTDAPAAAVAQESA